ncbi:hypothetical protein GT030_13280 [Streptomyces sp. SID1328]|uniref:hypothetical protein n=1 Tax=Streptomyces sp. SID1328 TaxID=2690250 RepID=UPI0013718AA4|nr:hypothetical protein [Streptomyces sp. SID1328]MYV39815.1 hypothetical protein [Streptomyces sp. SID1328]
MKIAWFLFLGRHLDEYGYHDGLPRAAIGTGAVLLTAALFGFLADRSRPAAWAGAGLTTAAGIGWLAWH